MKSPFPAGWWSFDLGRYRRCDGTYALYAYESVPPIDESQLTGVFRNYMTKADKPRTHRALAPLVKAAGKAGVTLPAAFRTFMGDVSLQNEVPSCTACEWDLSAAPVPCKVVPGAFTVRFLRDQQDCLFWYLHLLPDGDAHVLCSPIPFDEPSVLAKITPEVVIANTWYCAPHFEHFVYRFWIENVLWDLVHRPDPVLTPAQRAYVAHYAAPPAAKQADDASAAKEPAGAKQAKSTKAADSESAAGGNAAATAKVAAKADAEPATARRATGAKKQATAKRATTAKQAASKAGAGKGAKQAAAKQTAGKGAKKAAAKQTAGKGAKQAAAKQTAGKGAKQAAAKQTAGKGAKQAAAKQTAGKGAKKAAAKQTATRTPAAKMGEATMKSAKRSTAKKVTKVVS